jgi:nicotinamidase-related amidase
MAVNPLFDSALLVIDVQKGIDNPQLGKRNNPDAEQRMAELLAAWREAGRPVIHVQHMSTEPESLLRPGQPGNAIKDEARPIDGEPVFQKNVNSAFIGTQLESYLRLSGIDSLVMVGLTTEHCISSSARQAANLGFRVTVVADATATFARRGYDGKEYSADVIHGAELASLSGEFAAVVESRDILAVAHT